MTAELFITAIFFIGMACGLAVCAVAGILICVRLGRLGRQLENVINLMLPRELR